MHATCKTIVYRKGKPKKTLIKYDINPLANYLYGDYRKDEVKNTIEKYNLGTAKIFNGATIFWQKDDTGNIRTGKIMAYDASTGKRLKMVNLL